MKDPFYDREVEKYGSPIASREVIISYLESQPKPASLEQIAQAFDLNEQKDALHRRLRAMEREGQVIFTRRKCYALPDKLKMVKGTVIAHKEGFGFLKVEGQLEDYFISNDQMRQVLQGDIVLAQPIASKYKGKNEVRIVRILTPRNNHIVGRYFIEQGVGFVVPDDNRLNFDILVSESSDSTVRMGSVVVVELIQRPERHKKAVGKIIEVLGENMGTKLAIDIALRTHDIPYAFSSEVEQECQLFNDHVTEEQKAVRVDLTNLPLVTIDGEDARDFDDAVYCETKRGGGFRLWVAIADVSFYVRPSSALDKEALARGNSVYFPSRVVPMLPEVLSNGLCSLNPNVDRLCLVCEMTISAKGKLTSSKFYEAVMRSKARLTYTKVSKMLEGDLELREQYREILKPLEDLHALYQILNESRELRGAIGFESEEPKFIFNADKRIERIEIAERNVAHKMIEECMILANISAAKFVSKHKLPLLYRVHDKPDETRLQNLRKIVGELGLTLKGEIIPTPENISDLMQQIEHRPDKDMLQTLVLRSMKQAIYDQENKGHFGLALEHYAHFTSPIRRYPDLSLHRTIKWILVDLLDRNLHSGAYQYTVNEMLFLGEHCSLTERRADEAVRDVVDWLKCDFMLDHVGEVFDGMIASVTNFGFFVRLDDLFIDGLVHVSTLENDYYQFDQIHNRLVGENTGTSYRLGDRVTIKVLAVNTDDRKIDFGLEHLSKQGKKIVKSTRKSKNSKKSANKSKNKTAQKQESSSELTKPVKKKKQTQTDKEHSNNKKSTRKSSQKQKRNK